MSYPAVRLNRLRASERLRRLVRESSFELGDLVQPIFVHHGEGVKNEISSMPGQFQYSVDRVGEYARALYDSGIGAVLLFGIPAHKNAVGSDTWDDKGGIIQQALRALRQAVPDMLISLKVQKVSP